MSYQQQEPDEDEYNDPIEDEDDDPEPDYWLCMCCGYKSATNQGNWGCPKCGALMEEQYF